MQFGAEGNAGKTALEQRHEAGDPVSDYEQEQEGHGNVVLVDDGVPDGGGEIGADEQLDPRDPAGRSGSAGARADRAERSPPGDTQQQARRAQAAQR